MSKTILITGATDGIGLEAAKLLLQQGHRVLLHGRNPKKLERVASTLKAQGEVESYVADLSDLAAVANLADQVITKHQNLDVLINNAGVLKVQNSTTKEGIDVHLMVNTVAPYLLTKKLLTVLKRDSRIINVASAAQAPVDLNALMGKISGFQAMEAYSQSKLAIIMWSYHMASSLDEQGPGIIAVNPGSLLASKMVKEGFGIQGNDLSIGASILARLAVDDEYKNTTGKYFDNDKGYIADPHSDALNPAKCEQVTNTIEQILEKLGHAL